MARRLSGCRAGVTVSQVSARAVSGVSLFCSTITQRESTYSAKSRASSGVSAAVTP